MFYRSQLNIKHLTQKYYEEDATCPKGHVNPAEFIPYSSIPFFSPTTIRNVVKALRNNEDFVDVHFYNPQIASAYTSINRDIGNVFGAPSLHYAHGGQVFVIPIEVLCVFMLNAPLSSLPVTVIHSKGYMHYDSWDGMWKLRPGSISNSYDSSIVDRWDHFIKVLRSGSFSIVDSMRDSSKKKFLCRVRLTWFMTELHTIIRLHNSANRSGLNVIVKFVKKRKTNNDLSIIQPGLAVRANLGGIDRRALPAADKIKSMTAGYKERRNKLRDIHRNYKIPYGTHFIFNNYPSYFFNFLDHLSSKEKSTIRARYALVQSPEQLDDGFIFRTSELRSYGTNKIDFAPKFWWKTGVFLSCDCCDGDAFLQNSIFVWPRTALWMQHKHTFKTYMNYINSGQNGLRPISEYSVQAIPEAYRTLFNIDSRLLVDYRSKYRSLAIRRHEAIRRQQQQQQQQQVNHVPVVEEERRKMSPKDIPNNILWQDGLFHINKKANLSPKEHINLLTQGVFSVKRFITSTNPPQTNTQVHTITNIDPDFDIDPASCLLPTSTYNEISSRLVPGMNKLLHPYGCHNYSHRYSIEEQWRQFSNSEVQGADLVCITCQNHIDYLSTMQRNITNYANPVLISTQIESELSRVFGTNSRGVLGTSSEDYVNSTSKYFHRLFAYLQGGHSCTTIQTYGTCGISLDPKDRLIKNYTDNPLHYGVFSRATNERQRFESAVTILGVVGSRGNSNITFDTSNNIKIDKTCYLGVELEVTANKKSFDLARQYHMELGADPDNLEDYKVKELGLFIAASTCDRFFVENNRSAILKYDNSTSEIGFEIVSVPGTHAWHLNEGWKGFFREDFEDPLEQEYAPSSFLAGWVNNGTPGACPWNSRVTQYVRPTCGIHVHVSKDSLTHLQLGKMLVFVNANEDKFIEKVAGRNANSYSRFYDKSLKSGLLLNRKNSSLVSRSIERSALERYEAINLTSNKNTVEFRIFRSNVSKAGFFKCIDFVQALVDWTREESNTNINNRRFIGYVMDNRGKYPWMSKWLIDSKFVQTVAALNPKFTPVFAD